MKLFKFVRSLLVFQICFYITIATVFTDNVFADNSVIYISGENPVLNRTLSSGTYVLTDNTTFIDLDDNAGSNGLIIDDNSIVYIYIPQGFSLTATGIDGSGVVGGGAGIYLPSSSSLYLIGHGTVNAVGGNAANGEVGENALDNYWDEDNGVFQSGKGGNGGGGAGAGVGTNGANGGIGGEAITRNAYVGTEEVSNGTNGNDGLDGSQADESGNVYVSGVTLQAHGGAAGTNPSEISSNGNSSSKKWSKRYYLGGCGGGGNGVAGKQGNDIGPGGSSGAGGGSGARGGITWTGSANVYNPYGGHGGNGGDNVGKTEGVSSGSATGGNGGNGGNNVDNLPSKNAIEFSLTADNLKSNISFDNQGGSGIENITMYMGHTGEDDLNGVTIDIPVKPGYTFEGYYTETEGNGKLIYDSFGNLKNPNEVVSLDGKWVRVASEFQENLTLYADWELIYNVSITSDENGSVLSSASTGRFNDEIILTVTPNNGYEFDYWEFINGEAEIIGNILIVGTSDIEIKAHFKERSNFVVDCINVDADIIGTSLNDINKENAILLVGDYTDIVDHINNKTKTVNIFVETSQTANKNVFIDKGIDDSNGIFVDVDLYVEVDGEAKQKILDTNGFKVGINLVLSSSQASKIVGDNKKYYVLREHNGIVEKIESISTKLNDSYVFSFSSDKFSTFALCSEDKPDPQTTAYVIPNTKVGY